jgi:hypothetical protein
MYTRVYLRDTPQYVVETKYFSDDYLEPEYRYISGLTAEELTPLEIARLLDSDAESGNYHRLAGAHETVYKELNRILAENIHRSDQAVTTVHKFMLWLLDKGGLHNF